MIKSMTGYGRGTAAREGREITVELKSVNHRYLDLNMRLPRHLSFLEDVLRVELSKSLSRGHIDIYINYKNLRNDARTVEIDEVLVTQYMVRAKDISERMQVIDDLTVSNLLRLPDVVNVIEADEDRDALVLLLQEAVGNALGEIIEMRSVEGERLSKDLTQRADAVLALTESIAERAPEVVREYHSKLSERVEQLMRDTVEVDRARLATEVAIFSDKASIDEEIIRLRSHVEQMRSALCSDEPSGRKLDFIVQELNREFNTIGSKANDVELVNAVLRGKGEIEKIREQVQNIE